VLGDGNYRLDHAPLHRAAAELNAAERLPGRWALAESMSVFGGLVGRGFPVVLSLLQEGSAAASSLAPQDVTHRLAALWESAA
jgi:predicted membrane-bound spermidine synthase